MPGIFINDGGATSSALGSALGNLATTVGPKAAAEAQLLFQQTQGQDLSNERNWSQQVLDAAAARNAGGILATGGADAQPPGGSVASTAASLAQPPASIVGPGGRYPLVDPTGMTPNQTYVAGRLFTGMSPADLTSAINLGRTEALGPGQDYTTLTAQHAPVSVSSGVSHFIDPTKGDAPGNVISGPSSYESTVAATTGASNPPAAEHDIAQGADATVNLGKAEGIQKLYDQYVAPEATPGGIFTEGAAKNLSDYLGIPVDRILQMGVRGVKAEIRSRFASMVSNLRDNLGQPMFKGGLPEIMSQFPDPDLDPVRFRSAMTTLTTTLQQQAADGQAAMEYYKHPTPEAYVALLQQKAANAANAKAAFATIGVQDKAEGAGEGGGGGAGGEGGGALRPATSEELAFARAAISRGQSKADVIAHAKQKGIDLGAGF
jgi:hypothetical protein